MGVTIDNLQIEIQSSSTNASQGIDALATSLEKLKKNGSFKTVSTNLNNLSQALKGLSGVHQASNALRTLANSIEKLKGVGTVASLSNSLKKLPEALKSISNINLEKVAPQLQKVAETVAPLSAIKAGGLGTMVNAMKNLGKVTESLDDETIAKFAEKVALLNEKLGPLSEKMTSIKSGFSAINSGARKAKSGVEDFGEGVDTAKLNLTSIIEILRTAVDMFTGLVQRFTEFIDQATQWDGIAARFGRGFGAQAEETYEWIKRLNEEMGINIQQFMQYSSVYATMLTGFGVANEDAAKMALGYTELTYDIWAGYNDIYETFDDAAEAVRSAIAGEVEPVRRAGFTIVESTLEQTAANHGLEISIEKATEAQKSYLRYLTLVDQAHAQGLIGTYAKEMNTAEGLLRTLSQQLKSLTQAFGSLFLPILVRVIPWVQAFVELLTEAVYWSANLFGIDIQPVDFSGYEAGAGAIENVADSAGNATGALNDATDAAKKLKDATVGIDELNVISPSSASSGSGIGSGGSGSGIAGFEGMDIDSLWDDSIFDTVQSNVDDIKNKIKGALADITAIASGFSLALGAILLFTGANIPLGLGLMALGAVGLARTIIENWSSMDTQLAKTLTTVTGIVGGFTLALGALLAFSGASVPTGIMLMAVGATSLVSAIAINWHALDGDIMNVLSYLTGAIGGALLAVGGLLAFSGVNIPLGIALMAGGAASIATAVGLNWDALTPEVKGTVTVLEAVVGGGMLALGALLAFTGISIGQGIALMALGAVSLASAVALNWDSLTKDVQGTVNILQGIMGGALLAIGGVLAFSGANVPYGIMLIAMGAVSLVSAVALNWGGVTEKVKSVLNEILTTVSTSLLAMGAILALSGIGVHLGVSLMAAGAVGLVSVVASNWDSIVQSVKDTLKKIGVVAGTSMLALGVILCLSGVGIPLGIALIAAGAASLVSGVALNWDAMTNSIKRGLSDIDGLGGDFKTVGGNLLSGLFGGFSSGIGEKISNWCTGFVNGIKNFFGIRSPSTLMKTEVGKNLSDGIANGMGIDAIKTKLSSMWSSAKTWWNEKKGSLKTYTPSIGSIYDKLKERWDSARTWWNEKKSKLKEYTPSIGSIYEKVYDRWKNARDWWNNKKASMKTYTPSIGSIVDKVKSAWNTAKNWWKKNVGGLSTKLNISVPKIKVKWDTASAFGKSFKYPTGFKLEFAKDGGIFDQGSLIWAGERGPEVMATAAGGKTGVMNVQQMQDAVYEGVYAAVSAAMRGMGGGGTQAVNVYLDGKQITSAVEKRQHERGASIMGNEVYSY